MKKYVLGLILLYFLPPPLESAYAKRRQPYLGPLDEVSALGLGAAVAMAPVGASGRQRHGSEEIILFCKNMEIGEMLW